MRSGDYINLFQVHQTLDVLHYSIFMNKDNKYQTVSYLTVSEAELGQRIDNFLFKKLKSVPKSAIYRIIRKGELRVNKKRVKAEYKLVEGDLIRIPPLQVASVTENKLPPACLQRVQQLADCVLYEDEGLLIINKPSGMAVHGGSGLDYGVIEALRALRPQQKFLELVHRLDRETSGCLMVAKKRAILVDLQQQLREKTIRKYYYCLVKGRWSETLKSIDLPLDVTQRKGGERVVKPSPSGKVCLTTFKVLQTFQSATLLEAFPRTGRTHQIRVHCASTGHGIAQDTKYGDPSFDTLMQRYGLNRLFLHAQRLQFKLAHQAQEICVEAPLEPQLQRVLQTLP